MLGSRGLTGANVRPSKATSGVVRVRSVPSVTRAQRKVGPVQVQAFFNFFTPAAPAGGKKAAELVDALIGLVSVSKPSEADVSGVVKQLQPFGIKNPVRSKQLFGEYKLVYSSKPIPGSPRQILEEPDVIREVSATKALGLFSATSTQSGELNGIDNNTYEEVYDRVEVKSPLSTDVKTVNVVRTVTVLYLDPELRVVRIQKEGEEGEGTLAVYQRVEEEEEQEVEERKPGSGIVFFGGAKEGIATTAEREVWRKMAAEEAKGKPRMPANLPPTPPVPVRGGTQRVGTTPVIKAATMRGTQKVEAKPSPAKPSPAELKRKEAEAAKAKEAEARAKAKEAEARAREQAAAKERAEAEKRAQQEKAAAIKAQVAELSDDFKEAQDATRQAAKEAKDLERNNQAVLKQVAGARLQLRNAAEDVEEVEQALAKAGEARAAAEAALKQALAEVTAAQNKVKAVRK